MDDARWFRINVSTNQPKNALANTYGKAYHDVVTSIPVTTARSQLYYLIEHLQGGEAPVLITGKKGNAVLVSEQDWRAIEETLFLASIPGMSASIRRGMREPMSRCAKKIDL